MYTTYERRQKIVKILEEEKNVSASVLAHLSLPAARKDDYTCQLPFRLIDVIMSLK